MRVLLLFVLLMVSCGADAAEGFVLRKAAISDGQYMGTNRNSYMLLDDKETGERLAHATTMTMDIDLICTSFNELCMYWDNDVIGKASNQQYRQISWSFRFGFAIGRYLEFGYRHLSEHILDQSARETGYPLENTIELQFKFVESPRRYGGR